MKYDLPTESCTGVGFCDGSDMGEASGIRSGNTSKEGVASSRASLASEADRGWLEDIAAKEQQRQEDLIRRRKYLWGYFKDNPVK